jgi:hypothetical protein
VQDHVARDHAESPEAMNSLNYQLYAELEDAVRGCTARVMVITGEGRAFCAGDDVKQILGSKDPAPAEMAERGKRTGGLTPAADALLYTDIPVIAAVNGAGGGLGHGARADGRHPRGLGEGQVRRAVRGARAVLRRARARPAGGSWWAASAPRSCCSPATSSTRRRHWPWVWCPGWCRRTT